MSSKHNHDNGGAATLEHESVHHAADLNGTDQSNPEPPKTSEESVDPTTDGKNGTDQPNPEVTQTAAGAPAAPPAKPVLLPLSFTRSADRSTYIATGQPHEDGHANAYKIQIVHNMYTIQVNDKFVDYDTRHHRDGVTDPEKIKMYPELKFTLESPKHDYVNTAGAYEHIQGVYYLPAAKRIAQSYEPGEYGALTPETRTAAKTSK